VNKTEVAALVALLNRTNPLNTFDESKVDAWFAVFTEQAPDIDASFIMRWASKRASSTDDLTLPSHVVKAWKDHKSYEHDTSLVGTRNEAHCKITGCQCTHTGGCYKGWFDSEDGRTTTPCPVCRTSLSLVLQDVAPLGYRTDVDHARIRTRDSDA
jgi:hypothetical protein